MFVVGREDNWTANNTDTGSGAQEVLHLNFCLLQMMRRGPCNTVLKYECTIMCTVLYSSKWHQDLPSQARAEEFGEGMLSKVVRDKAKTPVSLLLSRSPSPWGCGGPCRKWNRRSASPPIPCFWEGIWLPVGRVHARSADQGTRGGDEEESRRHDAQGGGLG